MCFSLVFNTCLKAMLLQWYCLWLLILLLVSETRVYCFPLLFTLCFTTVFPCVGRKESDSHDKRVVEFGKCHVSRSAYRNVLVSQTNDTSYTDIYMTDTVYWHWLRAERNVIRVCVLIVWLWDVGSSIWRRPCLSYKFCPPRLLLWVLSWSGLVWSGL